MPNHFDDLAPALKAAAVAMRSRAATYRTVARKCAPGIPPASLMAKAAQLDHFAEVLDTFNLDLNHHCRRDPEPVEGVVEAVPAAGED